MTFYKIAAILLLIAIAAIVALVTHEPTHHGCGGDSDPFNTCRSDK